MYLKLEAEDKDFLLGIFMAVVFLLFVLIMKSIS